MQLYLRFKFFCFVLLLFAYRVRTFQSDDLQNGDDGLNFMKIDKDFLDNENFEHDHDDQPSMDSTGGGSCANDQFKCVKSGECIDKYKYW